MESSEVRRVRISPAKICDTEVIANHWKKFGENKVDVRSEDVVAAAVHSGGLHTFSTDEDGLIGTGAIYPYENGKIAELASSCWDTRARSKGGAQASVAFRTIYTLLVEQPLLIGSELYHNSVASARVLQSLGFEELPYVPYPMQKHAYDANAVDPVRHFIIGPWHYSGLARLLLKILDGKPIKKDGFRFEFSDDYLIKDPAFMSAIERLAQGDLKVVGIEHPDHKVLSRWVDSFELGRPISFKTLAAEQSALRF